MRTFVRSYTSGRISRALVEFLRAEAAGGVVMIGAAALAVVVANTALVGAYDGFWASYAGVRVAEWRLEMSLHHWVNDGLMAVFFFVVGLEIKRELLFGELADPRRAALPVIAAAGGAAVPALVFLGLNAGGEFARGWGVPMATDIAFAVTILAMLGRRAPLWLKSFVVALAIADDVIAVLVIAVFYTATLDASAVAAGGVVLLCLAALNLTRVMRPAPYVVLGIVLWYFALRSGVHATIAGVATAAFVPASLGRTRSRAGGEADEIRSHADALDAEDARGEAWRAVDEREAELGEIAEAAARSSAPLYRLEHAIHPWTAFVVLPVFAFGNAGVEISAGGLGRALVEPLGLGIAAGLVVGKPVGVVAAAWIAVRTGAGRLPAEARWPQVWGGGALAGIGFTMAIFIASLAFEDPMALDTAKLAIVTGSLASAAVGVALLLHGGGNGDG